MFSGASQRCSGVLRSVCSVGAVLQLLKLSGFKHTVTLSTVGVEITRFHFCSWHTRH